MIPTVKIASTTRKEMREVEVPGPEKVTIECSRNMASMLLSLLGKTDGLADDRFGVGAEGEFLHRELSINGIRNDMIYFEVRRASNV